MTPAHDRADSRRLSWHVRLLLGGYPPWWRLRYDDEMRDTLLALHASQGGGSVGWDLARGLVDAWLHPTSPEVNITPRTTRLVSRTAWGLLLLVLSGGVFAKVVEDPAFSTAADAHPALAWCLDAVRAAALGCSLIAALAAVVALPAMLRLPAMDRRRCLLLLAVVPACGVGWLAALAATRLVTDSTAIHSTQHIAAFAGLAAATVAAGACSTAAVLQVVLRLTQEGLVTRLRPAAVVTTGVFAVVAAVSLAAWTVAVAAQSPHLLSADYGMIGTPTAVSLAAVVAGFAGAALLCGQSAVDVLSSPADAQRSSR